jgi:hypothetical protein
MVVGGELPCSKEEAASLAGIQLRLEETFGDTTNAVAVPRVVSTQHGMPQKLNPISEDKVIFFL